MNVKLNCNSLFIMFSIFNYIIDLHVILLVLKNYQLILHIEFVLFKKGFNKSLNIYIALYTINIISWYKQ
ncbi:hypothetical protein EB796_003828 [Bugula neritina]|uniref:Uncharacterized protein n=1 Tax=Bugula neritina TaxID=10212 RepID=A0A7J7KH05_BUGNE|nr:hypothetical protein EB796_003828 [Bugula neritina]